MLIAGIHHVSINVADTDRSLQFYEGVLGMAPLPRPDFGFGGAWLDAGDGRQVHLIEAATPDDLGQHFAFYVTDIDASIDALRAAGVEVGDASPVGSSGMRQAFLHDPDGNLIELNQP